MSYTKKYNIDVSKNKWVIKNIVNKIVESKKTDFKTIEKILTKNPGADKKILSKSSVLIAYKKLKNEINLSSTNEKKVLNALTMKKIRSMSGVTVVTVLTKPFPCPGKCIFCPNDVKMPKSYLSNEPGAQRAESNRFDPYLQTFNRLIALRNMGHPTDKIELIILGGTWTHYPKNYQIWFVKRCFDALNEFGSSKRTTMLKPKIKQPYKKELLQEIQGEVMKKSYNQVVAKALTTKLSEAGNEKATWEELFKAHEINETAKVRCVGLVIETRPDEITQDEVINIRKLGATKVQIGIQSLNDAILTKNKRGHDVKQTQKAINLLRQAGFKVHAHWMPNLYGSTVKKDISDFKKLYKDINIRPDELKVYPCSLIASAELMKFYKKGLWKPYSTEELLNILLDVFRNVPNYTRITRMIRDIPGTDIVIGNKITNFRQLVEQELKKQNIESRDIRAREIKNKEVRIENLELKVTKYLTGVSTEYFLEYVTKNNKIVGFLRLSLPTKQNFIKEIDKMAMIREVHVYGKSLNIGISKKGKAQHIGIGKRLINKAERLSKKNNFKEIAVISSIGTRKYYEKLGFELKNLYQVKMLE